jgi:hypothetical protein
MDHLGTPELPEVVPPQNADRLRDTPNVFMRSSVASVTSVVN